MVHNRSRETYLLLSSFPHVILCFQISTSQVNPQTGPTTNKKQPRFNLVNQTHTKNLTFTATTTSSRATIVQKAHTFDTDSSRFQAWSEWTGPGDQKGAEEREDRD